MLEAVKTSDDLPFFLNYLYDGLEGWVCVATKEGAEEFHRTAYEWPEQRDQLAAWIKKHGPERDVYIAPAIFNEPTGRREDFKATNVVWIDCDGNVPSNDSLGSIPLPGLRVQSSFDTNQHWYWRLDTPLSEVDTVQSINRSLAYQLGADKSGWDANQVLRPPDTTNHKHGLSVFVLATAEHYVSPVQFDVLPAVEAAQVTIQPEAIPSITDVVLKYAFPPQVITLYTSKPEPGRRSEDLMKLGYYLAEMGMSDVEMFSVLRNADDRWGKFKDRDDRDRRLSDLIGVARQKYPSEIVVDENEVFVFGFQSFLNSEVEIEWVIPGLLQAQGYMLLTGPAGVGKTQFSLRWGLNLALGRSFVGMEVVEPQRILFLSLEMGHADLKFFLSTMSKGLSEEEMLLLEQNFLVAPLGEALYLDRPEQQRQMDMLIETYKPTGIFIDSVGSSSSGNVSDEATVKALMDFNDRLRQRHSVFTWFIHHNRKAQGENKKPNKLADVYGNQYLVNRATSVYCLWPVDGKTIEVYPLKKRLAAMEEPWKITRLVNLDFMKKETINTDGLTATSSLKLEEEEKPSSGMGGVGI